MLPLLGSRNLNPRGAMIMLTATRPPAYRCCPHCPLRAPPAQVKEPRIFITSEEEEVGVVTPSLQKKMKKAMRDQ